MGVKNWKVYVHINKINKKRYYGITKQKVNRRWKNGKGYEGNEHFTRAINKYGWDNFEHIVIAKGLTEEEAKWLEMELIREFDTTNRDKGYNITKGGDGTNGLCGELSPNFGKTFSKEHREKIGEARKGKYCGENSPNFGRTHSEESKKKMSEAKKGTTLSEETKQKLSTLRQGKNNNTAILYKVINSNGEIVGIFCGTEIHNSCSHNNSKKGFLNINKQTFDKYIKPFGNIDINRLPNNNRNTTKQLKEKLTPFDGWQFIKIINEEVV